MPTYEGALWLVQAAQPGGEQDGAAAEEPAAAGHRGPYGAGGEGGGRLWYVGCRNAVGESRCSEWTFVINHCREVNMLACCALWFEAVRGSWHNMPGAQAVVRLGSGYAGVS